MHALCSSEQCLCVSVLEAVCACMCCVCSARYACSLVEESLTTHSDKARLLPLPTGLQCMHCVLSRCMTFGIVVILSSQCDWHTQLHLLSPVVGEMLLVSNEGSLLSSSDQHMTY